MQQPDSENFLDWIHPFHAISSNFGSAGRKAPHPLKWPNREMFLYEEYYARRKTTCQVR